ncbi:hypothetical protein LCGC14_2880310, partial [marine sediment metagenome]
MTPMKPIRVLSVDDYVPLREYLRTILGMEDGIFPDFVEISKGYGIPARRIRKPEEFKEAIKTDPYFNALLLKYGYAVTCWKAQGGEWQNSIVDFSTKSSDKLNKTYFRWCYTALTRCKETLFCLNEPQIGIFDKTKKQGFDESHTTLTQATDTITEIDTSIPEHPDIKNDFEKALF